MMTEWLRALFPLPELCWLLCMSLAHTLWQCPVLWCLFRAIQRTGVCETQRARFACAFSVLLLMGFLPVINYAWLHSLSRRPSPVSQATELYKSTGRLEILSLAELGEPTTQLRSRESALPEAQSQSIAATPVSGTPLNPDTRATTAKAGRKPKLCWPLVSVFGISALYGIGFACMSGKLFWELAVHLRLNRICNRVRVPPSKLAGVRLLGEAAANKLGRRLRIPILLYQGPGTAMLVGTLRPLILLNASLASGLTPSQIEQILAHELAHLYRWDHVTLVIQKLVETLLFFHPLVWRLSREVTEMRELACDELVARQYCPFEYAETLLCCAVQSTGRRLPRLAAHGSHTMQLRGRIEWLLTEASRPPGLSQGFASRLLAGVLVVGLLLTVVALPFKAQLLFAPRPTVLVHPPQVEENREERLPEWEWQPISLDSLESDKLLFGGKRLALADKAPEDLIVDADLPVQGRSFAQWQFGDFTSTSVAMLVEREGDRIRDIYLDRNRDRHITASERLSRPQGDVQVWLTELDAEVRDGNRKFHASRQIAIVPNSAGNRLKITTLGYAQGSLSLEGRLIEVRRWDQDGNGVPTDIRDRIAFDLDRDGVFDPLSEVFPVLPFMQLGQQRYSVLSDRLGQTVRLSPASEQGELRFEFSLDDASARLESLQGCIRDENGNMVAIGTQAMSAEVPTGHYTIDHLVVQVRDAEGAVWRMTLAGGSDQSWFQVRAQHVRVVQLLEDLEFRVTPTVGEGPNGTREVSLEPTLRTAGGLMVTNFSCVASETTSSWTDSVVAQFHLAPSRASQSVVAKSRPTQCSSSFG